MVEQLTEGNINRNDKSNISFAKLKDDNYFDLFLTEKKDKNIISKKSGFIVYFDIFAFSEVITILKEKYGLPKEEINYGCKFSFAFYFDENLTFLSEKTFLTASYYIKKNKRIPTGDEFKKFEEDNLKKYSELFECPHDKNYKQHFNETIKMIINQNQICLDDCRFKVLYNIETDAINLHSFFIHDLQQAKNVISSNLDQYLTGKANNRVNLDSRNHSSDCKEVFSSILEPENYPVARYPSNINYALSFMQQIVVNLSINRNYPQMRSVNGPPGTGKTTLLKDIFAELVVQQAHEITKLSNKSIESYQLKTNEKLKIGTMPQIIAEKGIVVASSNNGAVQNIVNELPLLSEIDQEFQEAICQVDYFKKIANSKVKVKFSKAPNGTELEQLTSIPNEDSHKFWGLFSLEGGKKENMDYILAVLKHVVHYIDHNHNQFNPSVYQEFQKHYKQVNNYKRKRQKEFETLTRINDLEKILKEKKLVWEQEKVNHRSVLETQNIQLSSDILTIEQELSHLDNAIQNYQTYSRKYKKDRENIESCINALMLQKPGFFSFKNKKIYKHRMKEYSDQFQKILFDQQSLETDFFKTKNKIENLQNQIQQKKIKQKQNQEQFLQWNLKKESEIKQLQDKVVSLKEWIKDLSLNKLDFSVDYESLQLSNPWFDDTYRRLQSQLFISALKVRKQFLFENIDNIRAAYDIWIHKPIYHKQKQLIIEAWNWMNMVIPVISSTFASFSRMCMYMDENSLGHLFIDEAGQALPQASVGAIFRSKNIMVVGDPSQIKPVLTLDPGVLGLLSDKYRISKKYLSEDASTQTLFDEISQFGFYKDEQKTDWIGIPLWVHRRCSNPIFDISNKISYGGNMVQGRKRNGFVKWYDVGGKAIDKYVKEQGEFLKNKIEELMIKNPDIINLDKKDTIYVITPFKNVAYQLSKELDKIGFTRKDDKGKPTNVGTVHTFQGKEAPIVFLVLGADTNSIGAANWAMGNSNPNIMNVAVTRAKEEFYIIGDKDLYLNLHSDVINITNDIIDSNNS